MDTTGGASPNWQTITTLTDKYYSYTSAIAVTTYSFRVSGHNSAGDGDWSNVQTVTTPLGAPTQAPVLSLVTATATSLDISWVAVPTAAGYNVQYSNDGSTWFIARTTSTEIIISALWSNTEYMFRVVAWNSGGQSASGNATFDTLATPPNPPTQLKITAATSSSISLSWSSTPTSPSILNWEVDYTDAAGNAASQTFTDTSGTVTGLSPGSTYVFTVLASNIAGNSGSSAAVTGTTDAQNPGVVSVNSVSATGHSIRIDWSAPLTTGGRPIQGYVLTIWSSATDTSTVQTGGVSYVFNNLSPETSYFITVSAWNDALLYGPATQPSQITTLPLPPVLTSFVAGNPGVGTQFGNGVTLTLLFDRPTNQPNVSTKGAIDKLTFSSLLGTDYTGTWNDAQTLVITIVDSTNGNPEIGLTTVTLTTDFGLFGYSSTGAVQSEIATGSKRLSGDWGLNGPVFLTVPAQITVMEDSVDSPISGASFVADGSGQTFNLTVEATDGQVKMGSWGSGSSITITGNNVILSQALNLLTYTPPALFDGETSIRIHVTQGITAFAVIYVEVQHVNHAPTISGPASLTVQAYQNSTLTGITLNDVDAGDVLTLGALSIYPNLLSIDVSANSIDGLTFVTGSTDSSSSSISVSGSLSVLTQFLPKLRYFSNGNTPSESITLFIQDQTQASATIKISITATCTAAPTPDIASAWFADNYGSIRVQLKFAVLSTSKNCSQLFTSASIFGTGSVCQLDGSNYLNIRLGSGATIVPGNNIRLKAGGLQTCPTQNAAAGTNQPVSYPTNPIAPTIKLYGSTKVDLCTDYTVFATAQGVGGRPATFAWSSDTNSVSTAFVITNSDAYSSVSIPTSSIAPGTQFTITATVTSAFGQTSDPVSLTVSKPSVPAPVVDVNPTFSVKRSGIISLKASATLPVCLGIAGEVVWSWSVAGYPNLYLGSSSGSSYLQTQASVLPLGTNTFTFIATAALASDATVSSSASSTVTVIPSTLQAVIAGGKSRSTATAKPFTLDGSASRDPDGGNLVYTWTCHTPSGSKCLNTRNLYQVFTNSAVQTFPEYTFYPITGDKIFTLQIQSADNRTATTTQTITLLIGTPLFVSITNVDSRVIVGDKLRLSSQIDGYTKDQVNYLWSLVSASTGPSSTFSVGSHLNLDTLYNPQPNFEAGATYTIRLDASLLAYPSVTGFATIDITVNPPATGGTLTVTPSTGPNNGGFQVVAQNWQSDSPLQYAFYSINSDGKVKTISGQSDRSVITIQQLSIGNHTIGVRVIDSDNQITIAETQVIATAPADPLTGEDILNQFLTQTEQGGDSSSLLQAISAVVEDLDAGNIGGNADDIKDSGLNTLIKYLQTADEDEILSNVASIFNQPAGIHEDLIVESISIFRSILDITTVLGKNTPKLVKTINDVINILIQRLLDLSGTPNRRLLAQPNSQTITQLYETVFSTFPSISQHDLQNAGETHIETQNSIEVYIVRQEVDELTPTIINGITVGYPSLALDAATLVDTQHTYQDSSLLDPIFDGYPQITPVVTVSIADTNGDALSPSLLNGDFTVTFPLSILTCPDGYTCSYLCALWDTNALTWTFPEVATSVASNQTTCTFPDPSFVVVFWNQTLMAGYSNYVTRLVFTLSGTTPVSTSVFLAELSSALGVPLSRFQFVSSKTQTSTVQVEVFVLPDADLPSEELVDMINAQSTNSSSPLRSGTTGSRITSAPVSTPLPSAKQCSDGSYVDPTVSKCPKKTNLADYSWVIAPVIGGILIIFGAIFFRERIAACCCKKPKAVQKLSEDVEMQEQTHTAKRGDDERPALETAEDEPLSPVSEGEK